MSERPRVLVELGAELDRVARTTLPAGSSARARSWRVLPAVALVLLAGTAAAFASGVIPLGTPAPSTPVLSDPHVGLGALTPGTVRLVPISTADPQGGPAWGMRVLSTTRGAGCIQVGRLVDGKLVALGQDGAFGNDGRAHALPDSTSLAWFGCTLLDDRGQFFDSVTLERQPASAAWWTGAGGCATAGILRVVHAHAHTPCPPHDQRDLYYGLLGPDAKSITYTLDGQRHTQSTVGREGAYLIVTNASANQRIPGSGGETADDVPVYSPITSIQYRDGTTCKLLTAHRWLPGTRACSPPVREPVGYIDATAPTSGQVATPITTRVTRGDQGRTEVVVSMKSRIAISNLRGQYELEWHSPRMPARVNGFTVLGGRGRLDGSDLDLADLGFGADIAAGQTLTATIGGFGPALTSGVVHGTVTLRYSTGPSLDGALPTAKVAVGSFTARIS